MSDNVSELECIRKYEYKHEHTHTQTLTQFGFIFEAFQIHRFTQNAVKQNIVHRLYTIREQMIMAIKMKNDALTGVI